MEKSIEIGVNEGLSVDDSEINQFDYRLKYYDKECETYFVIESSSETLVCNRYVHKDSSAVTFQVEIPTDIKMPSPIKISHTIKRHLTINLSGLILKLVRTLKKYFCGIESVKDD